MDFKQTIKKVFAAVVCLTFTLIIVTPMTAFATIPLADYSALNSEQVTPFDSGVVELTVQDIMGGTRLIDILNNPAVHTILFNGRITLDVDFVLSRNLTLGQISGHDVFGGIGLWGDFTIQEGFTLTILPPLPAFGSDNNCMFEIYSGTFSNVFWEGRIINYGTIVNQGNINNIGGTIINNGTFNNTGTIINTSTITNTGTIINLGTIDGNQPITLSSAPQNFTATSGDSQVVLSWSAPANDGVAAITSYQVSSDNGGTWETADSNTGHTFTGLTNGQSYTFQVRAVNLEGYGAAASINATPFTVPGAPQNFTATPGDSQVELSWTAPTSDGGAAITSYQVSSDNGGTWVTAASDTGHTFIGLINGQSYTFQVRAVNLAGYGAAASINATPEAVTFPGAPQNFSATPGDGQVELSWTAPTNDGGAAITSYQVSSDNGGTWVTAASNTGHTFTGLINGQSYTFQVRAVNSVGYGAVASITATPADTTPPTVLSITPTNGATNVALNGNIIITFSEAMDATAGTVTLTPAGSNASTLSGEWSVGDTVFTASYTGLAYETAHTVTVSGFSDIAGNVMTAAFTSGFTTTMDVPLTGIADLTATTAAMFAFLAISAILWGYVLRRKLRRSNG